MSANSLSKHVGRACAITASALLAASSLTVAAPYQALAIDETRTFTWANGSPQPEIPQTITGADGREYRLTNQTAPQQANASQTASQQFSKTESRQIGADQLGQVASIMPGSVGINENGFSGNIPRVGIDTTPVYRTENNRITSTADAYGDTADTARAALPQTINRNGRTLSLADSKVEEARKDTAGNVILYKAIGTYAIDVPSQVLDHYDVVARYSGTLTRVVNGGDWTIQATYSAEDLPAEQPREGEQPVPDNENDNSNEITMMPPQDMDGNTIDEPDPDGGYDDDIADPEPSSAQEDSSGIPIVPIAIGGGVVILGGLIAGIVIARKKKSTSASVPVAGAGAMAGMSFGEEDMDTIVAGMPFAGPVVIDDPQCQLIELIAIETEDADGNITYEYEQKPKADLEIEPSCVAEVPTIVYLPALEDVDGNPIDFVPTDGAQYWIAIDEETVQNVPNKDIIIASDDDKEIYRGSLIELDGELTDQLLLDTEHMTAIMNGTADEEDIIDISAELENYDEISEAAMSALQQQQPSRPEAVKLDEMDFEEDDLDLTMFDDEDADLDLGDDFASALEALSDDGDDDIDETGTLEFATDDSIDEMFDNAAQSSDNSNPFAAYGVTFEDDNQDNFDSDFEREMDDFEYDPELEPDVDEFDFDEDFQEGTVIEPETEVVDDDILDGDLDNLDFDDMNDDIVDIDDVEVISDESAKKDIKDFQDLLNSI